MGFFSWKTSDTNRSIPNMHSAVPTFPVYLLLPDGNHVYEGIYEGYGEFGGVNAYEEIDGKGFEIKLVEDPSLKYDDVKASKNCEHQGFFYPEGYDGGRR